MYVRTYSLAATAAVATEVTVATAATILALSSLLGFEIASMAIYGHQGRPGG